MSTSIIAWALRLIAAFIMVQSLFFKFSASEESVYIFSKLGMEPWGRIGTGVIELVASALLLVPRTTWIGAVLGVGTMSGALFFHLTSLGVEVGGDGGQLFIYAVVTLIACLILLFMDKRRIQQFITTIVKS